MRRLLFALLIIVGMFWLLNCGGNRSATTGEPVTPETPGSNALNGRLVLRAALIPPPEKRANILAHRDLFENPQANDSILIEGGSEPTSTFTRPPIEVVEDGENVALVYPDVAAANFTIKLGDAITRTDENGRFTIPDVSTGSMTLEVFSPFLTDVFWELNITDLRVANQLVPGADPVPTTIGWAFEAPCHMSVAVPSAEALAQGVTPDGELCGGPVSPRAEAKRSARIAQGGRVRNYSKGELGSYPSVFADGCIADDGPAGRPSKNQNRETLARDGADDEILQYVDSTCDYLVLRNCCKWEAQGNITGAINRLLLIFPNRVNNFFGKRHCFQIHRGRRCDALLPGDIGVKVFGSTSPSRPDQKNNYYDRHPSGEREYVLVPGAGGIRDARLAGEYQPVAGAAVLTRGVCPGESVRLIVHNNSCTGETDVRKTQNGLLGTLTGRRLRNDGSSLFGSTQFFTLLHYDATLLAAYDKSDAENDFNGGTISVKDQTNIAKGETDQELIYTAGSGKQEDVYRFTDDGEIIEVHFVPDCATPPTGTTTTTPTPTPTTTLTPTPTPTPTGGTIGWLPDTGGVLRQFAFDAQAGTLTDNNVSVPGQVQYQVGNVFYGIDSTNKLLSGFVADPTGGLTPLPGTPISLTVQPLNSLVTPSGRFLYVLDTQGFLGFNRDTATGELAPIGPFPQPQVAVLNTSLQTPGGAEFLYSSQGTAALYGLAVDGSTGSLTAIPQATAPFATPGGLAADPLGRFVFVADFLGDQVATFQVAADGKLSLVGAPVATGDGPGAMLVDPSGTFLYVAAQNGGTVSAYQIGSGGDLTALSSDIAAIPSPTAVVLNDQTLIVTSILNNQAALFTTSASGLNPIPGNPLTLPGSSYRFLFVR